MNTKTQSKVIGLISLNNITDPTSSKIEAVADSFPGEYSNEDEYVDFQMDIGQLVEEMQAAKTKYSFSENGYGTTITTGNYEFFYPGITIDDMMHWSPANFSGVSSVSDGGVYFTLDQAPENQDYFFCALEEARNN